MPFLKLPEYREDEPFSFDHGAWRIQYFVQEQKSGAVLIRRLEIYPIDRKGREGLQDMQRTPAAGITTTLLRELTLEPARRWAAAVLKAQALDVEPLPARRRQAPSGRKRGRPETLSRGFYEAVAKRWRELAEAGDQHIVRTLAEEFRRPHSNMAGVIRRCREMRPPLIPPSGSRRRGRR